MLRRMITVLIVAAATAACGCVMPEGVDPTVLDRYQEAMASRSPQKRAAQKGMGLLRPSEVANLPKLKVIEQSGKSKIKLTIGEAVMRALANNMDIRIASFTPAISREEMIEAAAAFDYVLFGDYSYGKTDERTASQFGGGQVRTHTGSVGIRQTTVTGASWSAEYSLGWTWEDLTISNLPRRYDTRISFEITQPLLRGGWPEVNLASLRIAAITYKASRSQFRQQVEQTVTEAIHAYLTLKQARRNLQIQSWLLDEARKTLQKLKLRRELDATAVEIKQTATSVKTREALIISAKKAILDAQDTLARLLADPQINLLNEYEIVPVTPLNDIHVKLDVTDQLLTSLRYSPTLEQARLAIALANVNVMVAKNDTLPRLDFTASATFHGQERKPNDAHHYLWKGDYAGYMLSLLFEYPIGNRQRLAALRAARFERLQAVTEMQNAADGVAVDVKESIRQVNASYEELLAQRAVVKVAREQLKALEDLEEFRARLTPEFLRLKLSAQVTIAAAELSEAQAITDYNNALIALARATGTVLQGTVLTGMLLEIADISEALPAVWGAKPWPVKGLPKRRRAPGRGPAQGGSGR